MFIVTALLACTTSVDPSDPALSRGPEGAVDTGVPADSEPPPDTDTEPLGDTASDSGMEPLPPAVCDGDPTVVAVSGSASYTSLQLAVDRTPSGDTILVCPGTWFEQAAITSKELTIASWSGSAADTVLTGGGTRQILSVDYGALTVRALTFVDGYTLDDGGAIVGNASNVTVDQCAFARNWAGYAGGAVEAGGWSDVTVTIRESSFEDNYADYEGGAVSMSGLSGHVAVLDVGASTFQRNVAGYGGGAVNAGGHGAIVVLVDGTTFSDDLAWYEGGALRASSTYTSDVKITNSSFTGAYADYEGGAISVGSWGVERLTVTDSVISGCSAGYEGSAIDLGTWGEAALALSDVRIEGNVAYGAGGGAISLGGWSNFTSATLNRTVLHANVGVSDAGIIVGSRVSEAVITLTDSVLTSHSGSAVNTDDAPNVTLTSTTTGWGVAPDDNSVDLVSPCGTFVTLGASETFTCDATGLWY